jgi:hypothetical protein
VPLTYGPGAGGAGGAYVSWVVDTQAGALHRLCWMYGWPREEELILTDGKWPVVMELLRNC